MNLLHIESSHFQTFALVLDSGANETACEPFKRRISIPCSSVGPLDISLVGFLSQLFCGLISLVQVPRAEVPDTGHKHFTPLREAPDL